MLEIVLTREDANTEFALLAEWLVEDRAEVQQGQPVCVVETTKATVEIEAPGAGTIVQLFEEGVEVELGKTVARIAESADELASLEQDAEQRSSRAEAFAHRAQGDAQGGRARGAPRRRPGRDREARLHHREGRRGADRAPEGGRLARRRVRARRALDREREPACLVRSRREHGRTRSHASSSAFARTRTRSASLPPDEKIAILRQYGAQIGDGRRPRRGLADRGAAGRHRGRRRDRPAGDDPLRGDRRDRGVEPVRRRPRAPLSARVRRRGHLGRPVDPVRRRRSSRPVGGAHGRRSRLRRGRGVRQRVPAGAHRPRGVPDDALADRHAQRRPLPARGLREPLRARSCWRIARRSVSAQ